MRRLHVISFALLLLGAAKHPSTPTGISLRAADWNVRYSQGVKLVGPSVFFVFPDGLHVVNGYSDSVNYLTTVYANSIAESQSLLMTVKVDVLSGTPIFNYLLEPWNVCVSPATARPYIEAQVPKKCLDATYTCAPDSARQWSNSAAIELVEGIRSVTVPFMPEYWSDAGGVTGQNDLSGFAATLAQPRYVGMTFGGGCFFGHGVNVLGGTAAFTLIQFSIQ